MKLKNILVTVVVLATATSRMLAIPQDPEERTTWELKFIDIIKQQKNEPSRQAILKLGDIVNMLAKDGDPNPRQNRVYKEARSALLNIPGHAKCFGSEIVRITEEDIANALTESSSNRDKYLHILGELPSAETVGVLGELLFDNRDKDGDSPTDSPWTANSLKATYALHSLGLKNPPVGGKFCDAQMDLPTWQLWYEQVRAGNRTFSFRGDPNIYNLHGVVSKTGAEVSKQNVTAVPSSRRDSAGSAPWFTALGLLVLCGFLGWFAKRTWKF